jgi:hypothetical protein
MGPLERVGLTLPSSRTKRPTTGLSALAGRTENPLHQLETNTAEREYFGRANKHGKAVWRRIVRVTTESLPTWAQVATRSRIATGPIVATVPRVIEVGKADGESKAVTMTPERVRAFRDTLLARRVEQAELKVKRETAELERERRLQVALAADPDYDPLNDPD